MNSGKRKDDNNDNSDGENVWPQVPAELHAFAAWLRANPHVIEIWSIYSDWPQLKTSQSTQTLDSGLWFFCRLNLDEARLPPDVRPITAEMVAELAEFIVSYIGPSLAE